MGWRGTCLAPTEAERRTDLGPIHVSRQKNRSPFGLLRARDGNRTRDLRLGKAT